MHKNPLSEQMPFKEIENKPLLAALNELGRTINIITTYGTEHPAVAKTTTETIQAMDTLFCERDKLILGAFNGILTVDEIPVKANGALLKSLERRLTRLNITGLRITRGISGGRN